MGYFLLVIGVDGYGVISGKARLDGALVHSSAQ